MRVKRLIKISMIICVGICLSGCAAWFFPLRSAVDPNRYYVLRMPTKCKRCKWVFQIPDSTDNASGKAAIAMYNRKDTLFIDFVDSVYVGDMSRSREKYFFLAGGYVETGRSRYWACPKCGTLYQYHDPRDLLRVCSKGAIYLEELEIIGKKVKNN